MVTLDNDKPMYFDINNTPSGIKIVKRKTNIVDEVLFSTSNININYRDPGYFDNDYIKKIIKQAQSL